MKRSVAIGLMGLALSLSGVSRADHESGEFRNIVNLNVGFGTTNTMWTPTAVLRPFKGEQLRISVPQSCGPVTISQLSLWGRTLQGMRVPMAAVLVGTESDYGVGRFNYVVNGGRAATVREIGIVVTTTSPYGCTLAFEAAIAGQPTSNECTENYACPMHIDSTRYCEANPMVSGLGRFIEYRKGADNSCTIASRLKRQICASGAVPSQFQIECR